MTLTKSVTNILNGTIESVKAVLPLDISIEKPNIFTEPYTQHSIGVLIGMTGDARGRLIIEIKSSLGKSVRQCMEWLLRGKCLNHLLESLEI